MKYLPHQVKFGEQALKLLKENYLVYIQGKPRSGKTATALYVAEHTKVTRWLILSPKQAFAGWDKFLDNLDLKHSYTRINYEQVYKRNGKRYALRHNPKDYDGIIVDEAHNLGAFPKPSVKQRMIKMFATNKPIIYLSGTAVIESPMGIYHQFWLSSYSPFKHKNFYDFHRQYGIPYYIKAGGRDINQYDKYKPELLPIISSHSIYITQEDAGISSDIQAIDVEHYITLDNETKTLYNELTEHNIANIGTNVLVCDSVMKLRTSLHMLESGVYKIDEDYYYTGHTEKIDYIKKHFGDTKETGIMCHFVGERTLLKKHFKHASIYSSTSHAEGVDLSHLRNFVILSSGYSGAKFVQRRERIININGSNTLKVHHILVKGGISHQVYRKVSKKQDFNNSTYAKETL